MSLVRHLKARRSPIRAWFAEHFPATRVVSTEANRLLREGRDTCVVPPELGSDMGFVGVAVDLLLRAHLEPDALERTFATTGARRLAATRTPSAVALERAAVSEVARLAPYETSLSAAEWRELAVACGVLARFEQWYRAGPAVRGVIQWPLEQLGEDADYADLAELVTDPASVADLVTLGRVAVADHEDLRRADELRLNPTFHLSRAMGGADADVIAEHVLWDWKASSQAKIVGRPELWQVLGYALCDTDDEYGIRRVGVSAVRWRRRVSWGLDELIEALAAGVPAPGLDALRREFAAVVDEAGRRVRVRPPAA